MTDWLDRRLERARRLADEAGALAMRLRPPPGAAQGTLKGPRDWLTAADQAVETLISDRLASWFPEDGFLGEEAGSTRTGALTWVVDPIDGTSNYARGAARFCISIGLMEGDRPVAGVLVAPALGETFAARAGGGAFLNGKSIHAAATPSIDRAMVEAGWSRRTPSPDYIAIIDRLLEAGAMVRSGGSGALGLADVAAGRLDGYAELHINLWDVAAGLVVLREAGAFVSDFPADGRAGRSGPILAGAPALGGQLGRIVGIGG
ncbi:MAG: inositol monophosphatase [Rhodospirillales bacterium]|jgi:myo-inositol-1(or 4)-monophosphatase|nr:inositol monophosphatase [Rhodospirillales bacterium]